MAGRRSEVPGPIDGRVLLWETLDDDGEHRWSVEFTVRGEKKVRQIMLHEDTEELWEAVHDVSSRLKIPKSSIDLLVMREVKAINTADYRDSVRSIAARRRRAKRK